MKTGLTICAALLLVACGPKSAEVPSPSEIPKTNAAEASKASACPAIAPRTIGAIRLANSLGPGPMKNPPSVYPDNPDFASDYFLQGYNALIPFETNMSEAKASSMLRCFTSEESEAAAPPYLGADKVKLFRTGGQSAEFDAVEYMLGIKEGVATALSSAIICESSSEPVGIQGEAGYCPLDVDASAKAQGYGQQIWPDEFLPPQASSKQIFGLYRGQSERDAMIALTEKSAPEFDGQEGYQAPTLSRQVEADGSVRVMWQQMGYMDDAVAGEKLSMLFRLYPAREGAGETLQLRYLGWQQKCSRPGNSYWSTERCP